MFLSLRNWPKLFLAAALLVITAAGFSRLPELRTRFSPDYLWQLDLKRMQTATSLLDRNFQILENCLASPPTPGRNGYLDKIKYNLHIREIKKRAIYIKRRLPYVEAMLKPLEAETRSLGNQSGKSQKKNPGLEQVLAMQQKCREYENHLETMSSTLAKLYDLHLY